MLNRIIQSLSKSQLLYPKNRVEMGGGHDNSAFIPHHIFGVSQIPNTPATEIYCTGWNQGSACAWTYPFLLHSISALRFFHSRTFYPLKPLLSTGKMLSHYDTHTQCHQVNADGRDYWQNSSSNPVYQHSFRKWEHRKCPSLLPSKAQSLRLVFGMYMSLRLG